MDQSFSTTDITGLVGAQLRGLVAAMRPKQWTKNAIVFAGLIFSDDRLLFDPGHLLKVALAFVIFCLLSSAVYIMNDLADIEKDRAHPIKRRRPLPSGQLHVRVAQIALGLLLLATVPSAFVLDIPFGIVALVYLTNNIAYNMALKHMVLLDVFSIAAGFVLRAIGGAVVIDVGISPWLYVLTLLLALFLGFSKRRHELLLLQDGRGSHRRVLDDYSPQLLEEMRNIITASTVIAYSLYTFTAPNLPDNHAMMLTIPFALYGLFRYMYVTHNDGGAPPDEMLLRDRPLLATVFFWGITVIAILYFFPS